MAAMTRRRALGALAVGAATAAVADVRIVRANGFDVLGAIAAIGPSGGVVQMPAGDHCLQSMPTVPTRVTLQGEGKDVTRLLVMGEFHGLALDGDRAGIADFTLDCLGSTKTIAGFHGVRSSGGAVGQVVHRVRFVDVPGHGFTEAADGGRNLELLSCEFERIGWVGNGYVTGYAAAAIRALSGTASRNEIRGASKWGIELYPQPTLVRTSFTVDANHVEDIGTEGAGGGIGIEVSARRMGDRVAFNGVYNCLNAGIVLNACQSTPVVGNTVSGCPVGVKESGDADWNDFVANILRGNGTALITTGENTKKGQNIP